MLIFNVTHLWVIQKMKLKFQRFSENLWRSINTDRETQVVILSLIDFSNCSRKFLIEVFCSKYKINKAKMLIKANKSKGLTLPLKGSFMRNKLNTTKVEHFLDFIFDSGLLQDVAYGINKLKYDTFKWKHSSSSGSYCYL